MKGLEGQKGAKNFRLSFVFLHNVLLVLGNKFFSICNITDQHAYRNGKMEWGVGSCPSQNEI